MATNLSNTKMKRQVIPFLRDVSGRKNVESFSDTYLQERDSALSEYFLIHLHKAPSHEENTENSGFDCVPIIYCNDVNRLLRHVCSKRDLDMKECKVKIGIDSGGGFLKICFTICGNKDCHDCVSGGSIKELIIIGIAPENDD